jgi:hypothetical protein
MSSEPTITDPDELPTSVPTRRKVRWLVAAAAATAVLALLAIVLLVRGSGPTTLERAKQECAEDTAAVRVGDEGRSLVISRVAADEDPGANLFELACILGYVEMPDAVVSQMDGTRALDGRQDAAWEGFTASWTYHPNSGVNVILQESR